MSMNSFHYVLFFLGMAAAFMLGVVGVVLYNIKYPKQIDKASDEIEGFLRGDK